MSLLHREPLLGWAYEQGGRVVFPCIIKGIKGDLEQQCYNEACGQRLHFYLTWKCQTVFDLQNKLPSFLLSFFLIYRKNHIFIYFSCSLLTCPCSPLSLEHGVVSEEESQWFLFHTGTAALSSVAIQGGTSRHELRSLFQHASCSLCFCQRNGSRWREGRWEEYWGSL